jgi:transmembrane sensor
MKDDANNKYSEQQADRIAYLVAGFLKQTLSEKEHDELDEWITASDENQKLFEELTDPNRLEAGLKEMDEGKSEAALKRIRKKIQFEKPRTGKRQPMLSYGIAATILLLAGIFFVYKIMKPKEKVATVTKEKIIQPGGNKATLTLANGKTINLEQAKNGLIDSSEGIEVLKTSDGQLSYEPSSNEASGEHVLSTPVGGQYNVIIADGTMFWLNASSTIKYPVRFSGNERVVELTGEGYFEVAPLTPSPSPQRGEGGRKIPFIVKLKDGAEVKVLGTHFNIMAYDDEKAKEITLIEGRVVVGSRESGVGSRGLVPGEQAQIISNEIKVVKGVDVEEVVGWKNGEFVFHNADIASAMRQLQRWYDVDFVNQVGASEHFNATISRNEELTKLLHYLETTGKVHFKIENRKIYVLP